MPTYKIRSVETQWTHLEIVPHNERKFPETREGLSGAGRDHAVVEDLVVEGVGEGGGFVLQEVSVNSCPFKQRERIGGNVSVCFVCCSLKLLSYALSWLSRATFKPLVNPQIPLE